MANAAPNHVLVIAAHLKRRIGRMVLKRSLVPECLRLSKSVPQRLRGRP